MNAIVFTIYRDLRFEIGTYLLDEWSHDGDSVKRMFCLKIWRNCHIEEYEALEYCELMELIPDYIKEILNESRD